MKQHQNELISGITEAAAKIFESQCKLVIEAERPQRKSEVKQAPPEVAGVIGVTGSNYSGIIALYFSSPIFLSIIQCLLGEKYEKITQEIEDGAAELLNMIFGAAKASLNEKGHGLLMAIPTVLRGKPVFLYHHSTQTQTVPLLSKFGTFFLEFTIKDVHEEAASPESTTLNQSQKATFFQPFVEGTIKTFESMCGLKVKPQRPFYKTQSNDTQFDICGIVGITSSFVQGSFGLCFKKEAFYSIMSKILGETISTANDAITDGCAELVNIIFGHAKVTLNQQDHQIRMAIPSIVKGNTIYSSFRSQSVVVVPFESEAGPFWIEFAWDN